jgi:hypothetical protein
VDEDEPHLDGMDAGGQALSYSVQNYGNQVDSKCSY